MNKFSPQDYQIEIVSFIHSGSKKRMFCGRVAEIKNIYVEETSINKAYAKVIEEIEIFIDHYKEHNLEIPEPFAKRVYSGELRVRLGKDLHQKVAQAAAHQGISLNKFIINKLKQAS